MMNTQEAVIYYGVTSKTLRNWEKEGRVKCSRTAGGHRRYERRLNVGTVVSGKMTIGYVRESSADQREDLKRQREVMEHFLTLKGFQHEIISDLGSGLNYRKKGLTRLLRMICSNEVDRLVVMNKDRLLRFGSELIFSICEFFNVEVIIVNQNPDSTFEEELASDVLEILTVFSAKLYGSRSHKNKKLLNELKAVAENFETDV